MIRLILTIFSASLVLGQWINDLAGIDEDEDICKRQGMQCSATCEHVIFCASFPGDAVLINNCTSTNQLCAPEGDGYVCSDNVSSCPGTQDKWPVNCGGVGSFPAAYNCSLSYFCSAPNQKPRYQCECPENSYYASEYGACSQDPIGLQSCCEDSLARPKCTNPGDMGSFGPNCHAGYYYVCRHDSDDNLAAAVFRCNPGEIFVNGQCTTAKDYNTETEGIKPKTDPACKEYL